MVPIEYLYHLNFTYIVQYCFSNVHHLLDIQSDWLHKQEQGSYTQG